MRTTKNKIHNIQIGRVYKIHTKWIEPSYIFITNIDEDKRKYLDKRITYNNIGEMRKKFYIYACDLEKYDVELVS